VPDRDPIPLCPDAASAEFLRLIPREFAREHGLLSQGMAGGQERLAAGPATDPAAVHNVGVRLGREVVVTMADPAEIHQALDLAYEAGRAAGNLPVTAEAGTPAPSGADAEELERLLAAADRDLLATDGKAPMVRLVDQLLFHAVQLGASDLHIQPQAAAVVIRHRVDGVLDRGFEVPRRLLLPLVSRIKVMAGMDVAERLVPQDGRASVSIGARSIDLRIASLPTAHGERVVVRLLDAEQQLCDFARLGMPRELGQRFLDLARRTSGIVLVTGPTGSGKTTTLYATLRELRNTERNLMTIEDPIEYELAGLGLPISQSQVNERKGVNFANGLRHILRQDPDVILVGEIRDLETARIALQSSLTGHLVFSTLHTNDAASAVTRLIDLGVEPYLVAASLSGVLAQRLVRVRCGACGPAANEPACPRCLGTGFDGRTGVFELLTVDEPLRRAIGEGVPLQMLRQLARERGMRSLLDEGRRLVAEGRTTALEVERVIHD
jgi:general secretion pathway protein E